MRTRRMMTGVALAGVLALAGCGGGGGGDSDVAIRLRSASEKLSAATSATMKVDVSFEVEGRTAGFEMSGTSQLVAPNAVDFTMQVSSPEKGGEVRIVGDDRAVYVGEAGSTEWFKLDPDVLSASGTSLAPDEYLNWLNGVTDKVETVGTETIDGVTVTHYRADADVEKLAEAQGKSPSEAAALKEAGVKSLPIDVWLDADGLLRRLSLDKTFSVEGTEGRIVMDVSMSDYNQPVSVTLPPTGTITPGSESDFKDLLA